MGKRALSETDICDRFITPALHQAGWLPERILREHSFTDGRIRSPHRGAGWLSFCRLAPRHPFYELPDDFLIASTSVAMSLRLRLVIDYLPAGPWV